MTPIQLIDNLLNQSRHDRHMIQELGNYQYIYQEFIYRIEDGDDLPELLEEAIELYAEYENLYSIAKAEYDDTDYDYDAFRKAESLWCKMTVYDAIVKILKEWED